LTVGFLVGILLYRGTTEAAFGFSAFCHRPRYLASQCNSDLRIGRAALLLAELTPACAFVMKKKAGAMLRPCAFPNCAGLLRLDAGFLDHACPLLELFGDEDFERGRVAPVDLDAGFGEAFLDLRRLQSRVNLRRDLVDDVGRQVCRAEDTGPGQQIETRHYRLA